jgi:hypothetical protein
MREMKLVSRRSMFTKLLAVVVIAGGMVAAPVENRPAQASILGGALGGAIIGGLVGGRGGVIGGAIIGGVVGGVVKHNRKKRRAGNRASYYRGRMDERNRRRRRK